jgi:tetratricopeptide (TPR) repeat protein
MARFSKRRSRFNFLPLVIFIFAVVVITLGLIRGLFSFRNSLSDKAEKAPYQLLWNDSNYSAVLNLSQEKLLKNPFDSEALFFSGASSFYMALSMVSLEDKLNYLYSALKSLRINISLKNILYEKETYYLLGKTYVHLGKFYSDLAIIYFHKSKELGYYNDDIEEYLAISYSRLGDYEKSLPSFEVIASKTPTPSLFFRMGEDAFSSGDFNKAEKYLKSAVNLSQNDMIRLQSLMKLGELYFKIKNWIEAEKVLSQYLDIDYNNADVHFMLGEVFFFLGDETSARLEWHRTVRLDPDYRDALLRLYN